MAEQSAGAVWLDLLIRNTIGKQIDKMSRQAGAQAQKQFDDVGAKAGEAFNQSFEQSAKAVEKQMNSIGAKTEQAFNRSVELAKCRLKELQNQHASVSEKLKTMKVARRADYDNPLARKLGPEYLNKAVENSLNMDPAYKKLQAQQERLNQQMQAARDRLRVEVEAAARKQAAAEVRNSQKAAREAERARQREAEAAKKAADKAQRAQEKEAEAARRAHEQAAQRTQKAWTKAFSAAASMVKRSWSKATHGVTKMLHMIGRTMRRVFVLGAFLAFFHGLRNAMSAAIKQNNQLSQSLAQVKGNLYNAFASVFSAVLPALNAMMNGLASLTNRIASFMSALLGTTYTKSQAAAKQLSSVGKSAAGAGKQLQGALAGWDELNVLQKNDSAGGGSGGVAADVSMPADQTAASFGKALREAIMAGDWSGLGEALAGKFNAAVEKLNTAALGTKLGKGIQAAVQTAHSFIQNADWNGVGAKLADGLNHAMDQVDAWQLGAVLTSKWTIALGTLNGFIQNTNWGQLAQKLSDGIRGALDTMSQALVNFDWAGLGHKVLEFLCGIDWGGIFTSVANLAGSFIGSALSTLWAMATDAWNGIYGYFQGKIAEAGGNILKGILMGILDAAKNLGQWIVDHIFKPFWNGICNAFQIHSPSKKMMEIGVYIIEGMLGGITEQWKKVTAFFHRALADVQKVFRDAWQTLRNNTREMWHGITDTIKAAVNGIIGAVNGMIRAITGGINAAVDALNKINVDIPEWVPIWGGKKFGLNIPHVSAPQIPMLANGGVIKQPTLAMMGEYQGAGSNPEIAAPQSLMRETFMESIAPLTEAILELIEFMRDDAEREIVLHLIFGGNMAQLVRVMKPYLEKEESRVGVKLVTGGAY